MRRYCLSRTRKRLARLGWALLYLTVAVCCGALFFTQARADHDAWDPADWATLAVAGVIALGAAVLCIYETYTDLRDAFFPAKSRLAKSIRSQMPHPDETPDVTELFAMVDRDIEKNGIWFDRVAVGQEWVLGDEAAMISRIRGVFYRDEIKVHVSSNSSRSSRIVQLWLVDDRRQSQCTDFRSPSELEMAVNCLRLRCPDAHFANYNGMAGFLNKTEEEWQAFDRDFRGRREQRKADEEERERRNKTGPATTEPVQRTAHVARDAVAEQFAGLREELQEEPVLPGRTRLSLCDRAGVTRNYDRVTRRDVELAGEGLIDGKYTDVAFFIGPLYLYLKAGDQTDRRVTVNASRYDRDKLRAFETKCTDRQAAEWLLQMCDGVFSPDFSQWKDVTRRLEKQIKNSKS